MQTDRQIWMSALASAPCETLDRAWNELQETPGYESLRPPETGLVMVRGRAGGTGQRFNLGEVTVTRAAVRLDSGTVGHAYVAGRDKRKAELAALFDALLLSGIEHDKVTRELIEPLIEIRRKARDTTARKAAATRVNFFTMVRGED
ncbi:MAG TPA: phosphonate C-P lyase system protein PhnG [Azoarcus taiwanensis]|nr:phosphonate C-P lyase system protein PhnG [Azoarcus taiwanensis]